MRKNVLCTMNTPTNTQSAHENQISGENLAPSTIPIVTITAEELAERLRQQNKSERKRHIATQIEAIEDPVLRAAAKERAELQAKFGDE